LVDFGLALGANIEDRKGTRSRVKIGTPLYMAPEQIRRPGEVDGRADLFSVGVVLHELLTGKPPKRGRTLSIPRTIPVKLAAFLKRMLASDPKKRVASAKEARAALASLRSK